MTDRFDPDELEDRVERALRDLPPRRAPASLESRVLRELERRRALAWWRRSFADWPWLARAALIVVCIALVAFSLGGTWAVPQMPSFNPIAAAPWPWMHPAMTAMTSIGGTLVLIERWVPPLWLELGLGVAALLYAVLFGLGAAAYRTLYLSTDSR